MKTRTERDARGEIGIITHNGKDYAARGSEVTETYAIAYPGKDGVLTTWGGEAIGTWRAVASWPTPQSWIGPRMYQIEAVINGRTYTGRGCGEGMLWRGKIKKGGRRS